MGISGLKIDFGFKGKNKKKKIGNFEREKVVFEQS